MKNKKGISIGRILLYVLFLSLIALFIWTLYVTFKAMKKKTTDNSVNSSLRFAYNNHFDYSAADYLENSYMVFYSSPDFVYNYINGIFVPYNSLDYINLNYVSENLCTPVADSPTLNGSKVPYYLESAAYTNDNVFHIGSLLNYHYIHASETQNISGVVNPFNYFNYPGSLSNYRKSSAALVINCDIPLELWSGNCRGYFYNCESWLVGDNGVMYRYSGGTNFSAFDYNSLPSAMRANCSKIKKIILPVWQHAVSNGLGYFFVYGDYNYDYQKYINDYSLGTINIDFEFTIFSQDTSYQDGYDAGYSAGVQNADAALRDNNIELINQINNLDSSINVMRSQIAQQQLIIDNLNNQLQAQSNNFKGLFFTLADIPFKTVSNALGFEFWGVNLFRFFVGIITALGILWLIKRLYK